MVKLKEEQYFVNGDYVYTSIIYRELVTKKIYLCGIINGKLIKSCWYKEDRDVDTIGMRRIEGVLLEFLILQHYGGWEYKYNDKYFPSNLPSVLKITNQYGEEYDSDDFGFDQLKYRCKWN